MSRGGYRRLFRAVAELNDRGEFRFVSRAADYEATVGFYRDGLELRVVGGWDRGEGDRGTLFGAASGIIEILELPSGQERRPAVGAWLLVEVENVDERFERIQANGVPVRRPLGDRPWGVREFSVTDPDRVVIALFSASR